jgi:hypothetical protein
VTCCDLNGWKEEQGSPIHFQAQFAKVVYSESRWQGVPGAHNHESAAATM